MKRLFLEQSGVPLSISIVFLIMFLGNYIPEFHNKFSCCETNNIPQNNLIRKARTDSI